MIPSTKYRPTRPLRKSDDRKSFDCGVNPLNLYLSQYALQNQKKDAARTYVVVNGDGKIGGYYTLVYGSMTVGETPEEISSGHGKYPVPIILIARLAVSIEEHGKGLGRSLVRDALVRSVSAANIAGLSARLLSMQKMPAQKRFMKRWDLFPAQKMNFSYL